MRRKAEESTSKERRRLQLLEASRKVFAEKGFHDAKVDDIAATAGVAKGTVYLYFPDKRSIFAELIDNLFVRISAAILRVDPAANVAAQVKHNVRAILSVLIDDPDTMRMLFAHAGAVDPAFSAKIESFYEGLRQLLTASLEEGQSLGIVNQGDARLFASFTLGALREILIEATQRPQLGRSREQIVEAVFGLLEAGYLRVDGIDEPSGEERKGKAAR
jgi:AcrR family transcriptional regulator